MRGGPLIVYGDGSQTRSFCYISDMVTALMRLMSTPDQVTGPINLGNPEEVSVIEVAEKIIAATGSPSTIAFQALPRDDPTRRRPDISAARKLLDWHPLVSLDLGLERTIGYFIARQQATAIEMRERTAVRDEPFDGGFALANPRRKFLLSERGPR